MSDQEKPEVLSLYEFLKKIPDEESARTFFELKRWSNGKYCPHCESINVVECKDQKPMPYRCKDCRKHFSVRTGTTLEESRLPLQKWLMAIYMMTTARKGIPSTQMARELGITQKSAWFLAHRIRESWLANKPNDDDKLEGHVEAMVPFRKKEIRSVFHENSWWFSMVDVVEAVAETDRARIYWTDLKRKLINQGFTELHDKIVQLKMIASDGKLRETDCVDTETLFRVIQSIPSPKAEPFRKWLAKVGYERILEIQDPEIAIKRAIHTYKAKGYSDDWINARIYSIASRKEVTNEWKKRGIEEGIEYALLTDAISTGTFNLKTKEHSDLKGLSKHHNLRDHMSPLELALVMLGETTTAELARTQNAQGFKENKSAAELGGKIAGGARKNIEDKIGRSVVTKQNFLKSNKQINLGNDEE